jgi:hypothetical protein
MGISAIMLDGSGGWGDLPVGWHFWRFLEIVGRFVCCQNARLEQTTDGLPDWHTCIRAPLSNDTVHVIHLQST